MSLFDFCLEIIKREGNKFNASINTNTASLINSATASDVNYDVVHNRCSFLYRCGAITLAFAEDCFKKFFTDNKNMRVLVSKWCECPDLIVCSLTKGPALDFIGLLLSYQECKLYPPFFKNVKVVSKYGAWRNTINIMSEALHEGYLKPLFSRSLSSTIPVGEIEVIQGDPFENFSEKVRQPISESDIILMVKTLNLLADFSVLEKDKKTLQEFFGALKPGATLFCIDTKPSISLITRELAAFPGNFLLEPTINNTMINLENIDLYKNVFGSPPIVSARGVFFVWQKSSVSTPNLEYLMDEVTESVKYLLKVNSTLKDNPNKMSVTKCNNDQNGFSDFLKNYNCNNPNKNLHTETKSLPIVENDVDQNSEPYKASNSFQSDVLNYYYVKKEENASFKNESELASTDEAIQTESEPSGNRNIAELTSRIGQLTRTISEMLETNEPNACSSDGSSENLKTECQHSGLNNCMHSHCHFVPSCCLHKCQCVEHSQCKTECCLMCKHYKNHACQERYLTPNRCDNNNPLDGDIAALKLCSSCHNQKQLSTKSDSAPFPKLVIPLNNLSGDVIAQILSLISLKNGD